MKIITNKLHNKTLYLAYEYTMTFLALAILVILTIEFTRTLSETQQQFLALVDYSILSIFSIDYFCRLYRSQNKWVFFKSNIFDLVAIMPFDKAFRLARLARLTRLTRLSRATKLARVAVMAK